MNKPDIHRLLEFQQLLLKFSQIERVVDRKQGEAYISESDTEHSYNLALTAWYVVSYFPSLDGDLVIRLALIHDMVEIHAGDTYVYAPQAHLDTKAEREQAALEQLREEWPDFSDMTSHMTDYETRTTPEAKFVYALDKIMPIMQIYINEGYTWKREQITAERLDAIKRDKVALSPEIVPYYEQLYAILIDHPEHFN
jgi:putative hydrolases of HD superfamily